ncbi:MAG: tetratricopeptide repeat protein [Armatimonadota bacterium]
MTPNENEIDQLLTEAEALLQDEKPGEALILLDRASTLEPHHAWTMLFRGVALGQLGRLPEAIDQLIMAADENRGDIDIQVDTARYLSLMEQHQDALICVNRATEIDDNDAGAHAMRGEVLEHLGRIAEAIETRESALALDGADPDNRYSLSVDLCDLGRYQEAYAVAEPLFDEYADDADIVRLHGACLSYLGRHEEALGIWATLERLEGVTPNLLHNRASTLDMLGLFEEALQTIDEAIDAEPDLGMNFYTRGMIHEHEGDDASAIEDYLTALMHEPDHLDAVMNLVELSALIGAVPLVIDRIDTLLQSHPTSAKLLYARGRLAIELGKYEEGKQFLEAAIRLEPGMGLGWYTLTMLYSMIGEYEETLTAADRAAQTFAEDPNLWLNRGMALQELKRFREALESFDRAVQLAPEDGMPWFHLGRILLLDLERPADARGALKEAIRLQPDNDAAMWMLALCYLRLNRHEDADAVVTELLTRDADHLWGRLVRAALHAQRGDLDAAFTDLQVVTTHNYDSHLLLNEQLFEPLWTDTRFDKVLLSQSREDGHRR